MIFIRSDAPVSGAGDLPVPDGGCSLQGKSILVVEDEFMIAMDYTMYLETLGATVLGPVSSVPQALRILREHPLDAAVLDIDLQGTKSFMVADALRERKIGFVFATGYNEIIIPERFADVVRCEKPVNPVHVADALLYVCCPAEKSGGAD